jgi:hypothetical protein
VRASGTEPPGFLHDWQAIRDCGPEITDAGGDVTQLVALYRVVAYVGGEAQDDPYLGI